TASLGIRFESANSSCQVIRVPCWNISGSLFKSPRFLKSEPRSPSADAFSSMNEVNGAQIGLVIGLRDLAAGTFAPFCPARRVGRWDFVHSSFVPFIRGGQICMANFFEKKDRWGNGLALWVIVGMAFLIPISLWSLRSIRMENEVEHWIPRDN